MKIKTGDKVNYHDMIGDVKSVMDEMAIVTLPDGKDYSLPLSAITVIKEVAAISSNVNLENIIRFVRPHIKNVAFWNEMAVAMRDAGIDDLRVVNGRIATFAAKESLEEKIARYKAEAMAEAEKKARDDHQKGV